MMTLLQNKIGVNPDSTNEDFESKISRTKVNGQLLTI